MLTNLCPTPATLFAGARCILAPLLFRCRRPGLLGIHLQKVPSFVTTRGRDLSHRQVLLVGGPINVVKGGSHDSATSNAQVLGIKP
jgi:hypothetical protein